MTLVLIADDSDIVATSLEQLLEQDPHIHVVGRARNGRELVEHPALKAAGVVLLDLLMPELGGLSVIRRCGQCAVIAVSSEEEGSALAEEAKRRGFDRITVLWEPGAEGPGEFFHRIGFQDVGETQYGDVIGALEL